MCIYDTIYVNVISNVYATIWTTVEYRLITTAIQSKAQLSTNYLKFIYKTNEYL